MNEAPLRQRPRRTTRLEIAVLAIAGVLVGAVVLADRFTRSRFSPRGNISTGISNARQIAMALNLYAADHDGYYPDSTIANPRSANEVFRILFAEGTIDNEFIFGCPISPFVPDGNIGDSKDRSKALEAGENHWAMMWGLDKYSSGGIPLVFENPLKATWPLVWNPDAKRTATRGRAWTTGIIVGMNDGSAQIMPLASRKGTEVELKPVSEGGSSVIEDLRDSKEFPVLKILDVEGFQK